MFQKGANVPTNIKPSKNWPRLIQKNYNYKHEYNIYFYLNYIIQFYLSFR